jgi:hypothetical protein
MMIYLGEVVYDGPVQPCFNVMTLGKSSRHPSSTASVPSHRCSFDQRRTVREDLMAIAKARCCPNQHHQPFAARKAGMNQIAPQHRLVLSRKRNDHCWIFRALRLVNSNRVGGEDFIEFAKVIVDQPAIEIEHELLSFRINRVHEAEIAAEDLFVIIVDRLHHFVAAPEEDPKRVTAGLLGSPFRAD